MGPASSAEHQWGFSIDRETDGAGGEQRGGYTQSDDICTVRY